MTTLALIIGRSKRLTIALSVFLILVGGFSIIAIDVTDEDVQIWRDAMYHSEDNVCEGAERGRFCVEGWNWPVG